RQTGLRLSHVDGHHHMHLHPTVLRLLLPLASEFGASAVRVAVADELLFSLRFDRSHLLLKLAWKLAFAPLCRHAGRVAKRHGLSGANRVYGLMQSGQLRERYLVALLQRLAEKANGRGKSRGAGKLKVPEETGGQALKEQPLQAPGPVIEIFCHPSLRQESSDLGPNPGDLAALLSPAVRETLTAHGLLLTTYPECMSAQATRQVPLASGAPGPEG
ncbi:MAG: ChbG/HpnK family deacetylase, partial [Thermoleophilia bacterium]|nr:ChbG/HpnK family deacetylase [Thermoleophilia bacterium]